MNEMKFVAVLVGVEYSDMTYRIDTSMKELEGLANACNIECAASIVQKLNTIHPRTYVGSGKVDEIKDLVRQTDANLVIMNEELSPTQLMNLEAELGIEVCDRTYLILEIFSQRAQTKEAVLQVKLARLQYLLPRLIGMNTGIYSQQGGSGFRGSGEKKLELDRRRINKEMSKTSRELKEMVKQRQVQRGRRKKNEIPVIALVGYTNSGKSTLMNQMLVYCDKSEKQVLAKDMLFATLETSTRQITLPNHQKALIVDTVGFVDQLPHGLIKAFRSTLEEVKEADLLLHVVDASNRNYEVQKEVTNKVLKELDAGDIPMLYVFNKMDVCDQVLVANLEDTVYMSALKDQDIVKLLERVSEMLYKEYNTYRFTIPYEQSNLFALLKAEGSIQSFEQVEDGYQVEALLKSEEWNDVMRKLEGK
ncbi:MAG: GTPase HflX [Erysipelotrichales bacterium]|nr:GTPase HflX [Erysipelotrichales bacterium]